MENLLCCFCRKFRTRTRLNYIFQQKFFPSKDERGVAWLPYSHKLKINSISYCMAAQKNNTLNFFPFFASTTTTAAIFAYLFLNAAAAWSAVPDYKRNKKETLDSQQH